MTPGKISSGGSEARNDAPPDELTPRALILGCVLAVVFGAANAYAGLKVGLTVSASIPAAVVSMAILRGVLRRGTVLENNIVQTIGSSGEALAAGIIFTVPAFFMWNMPPDNAKVFLLALLGGFLGILMMIPLRRQLIVHEHGELAYPEGTACAEILQAGEEGGDRARLVFVGAGVGMVYKLLQLPFRLWHEQIVSYPRFLPGSSIGVEASPMLLGVGYLIGPRTAAIVLSGAMLGYLVINPLIAFAAQAAGAPFPQSGAELSGMLRAEYTRYLGIGAVVFGGGISLVRSVPTIISSLAAARGQMKSRDTLPVDRTQQDLPMSVVMIGTLLVAVGIWLVPGAGVGLVGGLLAVICSFFFVTVASRLVGIIGSSSNPVSGMTIASLLLTCLIFLAVGKTGKPGMIGAMSVAAIVCIAIAMAGDCSQDLKTGYLVGATPRLQQISEFIGVLVPAFFMGSLLALLNARFGFGPGHQLEAPQATAMKTLVEGVMTGSIPWGLLGMGALMALAIELMGVASLPLAIGLYLPPALTWPLMIGGLVKWWVDHRKSKGENGVLFSSGLVAGDALLGIGWALTLGIPGVLEWHEGLTVGGWMGDVAMAGSLVIFLVLTATLWAVSSRSRSPSVQT